MEEFPTIAKNFEVTYIGRLPLNHIRRKPPYPILLWKFIQKGVLRSCSVNNSVERWYNGFQSGLVVQIAIK